MTKLYYPIHTLTEFKNIQLENIIELAVDDYGNGTYVNKQSTIRSFGDFLISSHALFNRINELYNDKTIVDINPQTGNETYRYASDIYISGQAYFYQNPGSTSDYAYEDLLENQTVKKNQLELFIHCNGLEINPIRNEYTAVQLAKSGWKKSVSIDDDNPVYDDVGTVPFLKPSNKCYFNIVQPNAYGLYHTNDEIKIYSNSFVTIVGKVKVFDDSELLNIDKRSPYYTIENNLWAGVFANDNIMAITELHNYDKSGVAYFSMQFPCIREEVLQVVVPFKPKISVITESDKIEDPTDMFKNIPVNCVAVFYYTMADPNLEED